MFVNKNYIYYTEDKQKKKLVWSDNIACDIVKFKFCKCVDAYFVDYIIIAYV